MICYIKDRKTFVTKGTYPVSEYDIVLKSIFDDQSKITITGIANAVEGDWVYCDNGYLGVIQTANPDAKVKRTTLTCREALAIFDRDSIYDIITSISDNEQEGPLVGVLDSDFKNGGSPADPYLALGYLYFQSLTHTYYHDAMIPDFYDAGRYKNNLGFSFNVKAYLDKMRQTRGIFTDLDVVKINGTDRLMVRISKKDSATRMIDFSDKSYTVLSENYTNEAVGKVTVKQCYEYHDEEYNIDVMYEGDPIDHYLKADGTITTVKPADGDRVSGVWRKVIIGKPDDAYSEAEKIFTKNKYSHMIEFSTDKALNFYDNLKIRINGRILTSYISSVRMTSESNKYIYKSGELRTKQNKIRRLTNGY